MKLKLQFKTDRLLIEPLTIEDADFIFELVNTEDWLKFIGDRNIKSKANAFTYIQKILRNKDIFYWIVKLKGDEDSVGIITFIKREYLDYHDIGFALLPKFFKKGYAHEATINILKYVVQEYKLSNILAISSPENVSSLKLLNKIGLRFQKEIEIEHKSLHIYGASTDKLIFGKYED